MKREQIIPFFAVAIGGAIGTLIRYLIYLQSLALSFPFGTIIVNVVGSLLLGFLTGWVFYTTN
ncbi:CrcB family protein [Anaerobacillus sp. HL2]|nr:CrcB family protein [Anaerobacillus sp. HL2]